MTILGVLLLVICVISAILLVVVVLLQDEEGEGLGGLFSGTSSTPFGSRAGNILTRFTTVVAAVFLFGTFSLAWINRTPETGNVISRARMESLKSAEEDWWLKIEESEAELEAGAGEEAIEEGSQGEQGSLESEDDSQEGGGDGGEGQTDGGDDS